MIGLLASIAGRHLRARRRQSIVSLLGIVLGVSFFLAISAMMQGSESDFLRRLVDNSPHITIVDEYRRPNVQPVQRVYPDGAVDVRHVKPMTETRGIRGYPRVIDFLRKRQDVHASAVLVGEALVSFAGKDRAVTLTGIVPADYARVSTIDEHLIAGSLSNLAANPNGVIIGDELARILSVAMSGSITMSGPGGNARVFKIVGLFHTGRAGADSGQAFATIERVQALTGRIHRANTIVVKLDDPEQARAEAERIERRIRYKSISWQEQSEDLMSALLLRRIIMYAVVGAVLVVAAFGIYNVISTVVMEKQRDIAILRSMGFDARDIERIFVLQGGLIGLVGNAFGLALGSALMLLLGRLRFRMPGSTDLNALAIDWGWAQFALAGAMAMAAAVIAAWLPARRAARVEPVDVLRGGV
ncbi:MAG TPA: ABC transporter permease [Dokdonella sp.]|nr:ABC transporter permease [Dokdonella sp.]